MTDYVKRIQRRLNLKGVGKKRSEIIEEIKSLGYEPEKLSDESTDLITINLLDKFISEKNENNLFNSPTNDTPNNSIYPEVEDKINKNKLPHSPSETEKNKNNSPVLISDEDEIDSSEIIVSPEDKHELIVGQASCLGIELSEVEVIDLANNIKDSFLDHECLIEEVVTAIVGYHDNRTNRLKQKIKDAREHIQTQRKQLNQTLVGEFGEMNNFFRQGAVKRKELSKFIATTFKT
jgi:hypothetical protein